MCGRDDMKREVWIRKMSWKLGKKIVVSAFMA